MAKAAMTPAAGPELTLAEADIRDLQRADKACSWFLLPTFLL